MKRKYSLLLALTSILCAFNAFATDYYIDPQGGNDGNNGLSSTSAYRSLSRIDNINLQPGDTVFFMEGTYERPGQTLLTINESGTEDNYITFTNFENQTPTLEFNSWTGINITGGSSYIKIDGLHIKGARTQVNLEDAINQGGSCANDFTGNVNGFYNGTGILAVGPNLRWSDAGTTSVPHHIEVTNCNVYDCTSSGIAFQQADYVTIKNNKVYDNCWYTIYGTSGINLYQLVNTDGTNSFHNEITNNLMYGNQLLVPQVSLELCGYLDGNGLIIDDLLHTQTENYKDINNPFATYNAKTLVANNVSVENGGSGLHFYLSNWCYIYNNTIANNAFQNDGDNSNGELRIGASYNFWVVNNIIKSDYTVHHVEFNPDVNNINYSRNYQYGPDINEDLVNCDNCIEGVELEFLNTDVNADAPYITNFESLVKNAGTSYTRGVVDDYLGNPRPYDALFDIGAYELLDCELTTWYADSDNDGYGIDTGSISDCQQPEGYVGNSGDLCPNDSNKVTPGECGCGEIEGTCEEECEPSNWYADFDNDGYGDINDVISDCEQPEGYVANSDDLCVNDNLKKEPTNWYADFDGDGYGDINVVITDCDQPEDYVANSNDLCANDNLKNEPGECGCGENEGTCDINSGDICDSPEYSNQVVYSESETTVIYNGIAYKNNWYTQGQLPTNGGPWVMVAICGAEATDCSLIPIWSSNTVYSQAGTQIVFNESIYENKWYVQGGVPGENNAWELSGFCDTTPSVQSNIDIDSNSNDLVEIFTLSGLKMMEYTMDNEPSELNLESGIYIIMTTDTNTNTTSVGKISL